MAYDKEFKARALIRLAENRNDYEATAAEMGCSPRSLRHWANGNRIEKKSAKSAEVPQKSAENAKDELTVADYLEQAVKHMLKNPPSELKGDDWAITVGVLMDKWLLVKGQPTERTETISRLLDQLPEHERDYVYEEAERIVAEASRTLGEG
jgi:transposase-like protein